MSAQQPRQNTADRIFLGMTGMSALLIVILMIAFFFQLGWASWPSIQQFGLRFLWSAEWNPTTNEYGAAACLYGTFMTTIIALIIAVPLSFLIAFFLVELANPSFSKIMGQAIDLLAAVPSIVYGMWGLFFVVPFMQRTIMPFLSDTLHLKWIPLFAGNQSGIGVFTASVVLSIMILPFITAIIRDVFRAVPPVVKESAYGVGATRWEVARDITLRYGMQGILGGIFLGLGRAIGETMAVLFIIGNSPQISSSFYAPGATIASMLANNFGEATGIFRSALFELGLILLIITLLIQVAAQWWLARIRKQTGGGL